MTTPTPHPAFPAFAVSSGEEGSDPIVLHEGVRTRVDEYAASDHLARMDDDFAAVAGLGITVWRYGIPWRLAEPEAGVYDWTLWDQAFEACERHGLIPVVDLLHFGLPDQYGDRFADERWVEPFIAYVDAFLARYPEPRWFTPVNEPGVTVSFSTTLGIWNDRTTDLDENAAALGNVVRANLEALARIRADRDGWWIGSEGFTCPVVDPDDAEGAAMADAALEREWAVFDLHLGVEPVGLGKELVDRVPPATRARIAELVGVVPPERTVLGHDPYPVSVAPFGTRALRPLSIEDRIDAYVATADRWYQRYQCDFWVSETSNLGLPVSDQIAWLDAMVAGLDRLAGDGQPVRGICWYSRGDQFDWDLALIAPVGQVTTVGLFDADRQPRPVAEAYRRLIENRPQPGRP